MSAEVVTDIATSEISSLLKRHQFLMASVNSGIRWPKREPPKKGGHLVLVLAASENLIRFHNPSGHDRDSQANVELSVQEFDRFFANRGIAVTPGR
jgi:hypothetical protein